MKRLLLLTVLVACGESTSMGPLPSPVTAVTVEPLTADILVGEEAQFTARTFGDDGAELFGQPIQWATDDPSIASVSTTGRARGEGFGSATITASSGPASASAVLDVDVTLTGEWGSLPGAPVGARFTLLEDAGHDISGDALITEPYGCATQNVGGYRADLAVLIQVTCVGHAPFVITGSIHATADAPWQVVGEVSGSGFNDDPITLERLP